MLKIVQESDDGPTMIGEEDWINLPVGENLVDHVNVSILRLSPLSFILPLILLRPMLLFSIPMLYSTTFMRLMITRLRVTWRLTLVRQPEYSLHWKP